MAIEEVREALQSHGERYLNRVYTQHERRACAEDPRRLAACFAAKEAAMKALGRLDEALPWTSIELREGANGAFALELSGPASELARRDGVKSLRVSVAYRKAGAAVIVLAER